MIMENDKRQGTDNERRIEHMANLIEKQVRTERHLEQSSVMWIFGLLALALLTAHLYLLAAAKGGG